jgi:8-oxo-dGTP pyrophosphatase MutT (NUDIX family)
MVFTDFIGRLEEELTLPLPGLPVQLQMTSNFRLREMMEFSHPEKATRSSVLILLFPGRESNLPTFVVMLRPTYDGIHSGQISLPGGRYETEDHNLMHTALREAHEETGMDPRKVKIIGRLTELYIPPSNYLVQPFIGYTTEAPLFTPQPEEVEELIEIEATQLLDKNNVVQKEISVGGKHITVPSFLIRGTTVWGATAMILNEFREILAKTGL